MRNSRLLVVVIALGCMGLAGMTAPASFAASADHPYSNVDHRQDAGNDTGDHRVGTLNEGQLNRNYQGPVQVRPPSGQSTGAPTAPGSSTGR